MKKTPPLPRSLAGLWAVLCLAFGLWLPFGTGALAGESPLKPIDFSSPRSTFQGYLEFMNKAFEGRETILNNYLASSRLFPPPELFDGIRDYLHHLMAAERTLDLSELPPAMARESARRLTIQLKEVLDRIELPPASAIPDAAAMAGIEPKRWTIPGTEIRIQRVDKGLRTGEYLFDPATVARIPEFFEQVRHLPYREGATPGWYEFYTGQPIALAYVFRHVVPMRWFLQLPGWAGQTFLDQPLWRWLGIAAVLALGAGFTAICFRLSRPHRSRHRWRPLLRPLSLVVAAPAITFILAEVLRVSSPIYEWMTLFLNVIFYLSLTWLVWAAGGALAESVISMERLRIGSIDSQLIRLVMRLATVIAAILILVDGADEIGLPAYSVLAGLGVGGLAVALAAQQTLANLLGSLIIMFEKPFAIGDSIKIDNLEGKVEDVGFRSTRIRTPADSLVTIPSSQLVNSTINNMTRRTQRQVRTVLNLSRDTPRDRIEAFTVALRSLLESDPSTGKDTIQVAFHELGPNSLDILVNFFVIAPNRATELKERHRLLLAILELAEAQDIRFA